MPLKPQQPPKAPSPRNLNEGGIDIDDLKFNGRFMKRWARNFLFCLLGLLCLFLFILGLMALVSLFGPGILMVLAFFVVAIIGSFFMTAENPPTD